MAPTIRCDLRPGERREDPPCVACGAVRPRLVELPGAGIDAAPAAGGRWPRSSRRATRAPARTTGATTSRRGSRPARRSGARRAKPTAPGGSRPRTRRCRSGSAARRPVTTKCCDPHSRTPTSRRWRTVTSTSGPRRWWRGGSSSACAPGRTARTRRGRRRSTAPRSLRHAKPPRNPGCPRRGCRPRRGAARGRQHEDRPTATGRRTGETVGPRNAWQAAELAPSPVARTDLPPGATHDAHPLPARAGPRLAADPRRFRRR